jgi:hypothetical protein
MIIPFGERKGTGQYQEIFQTVSLPEKMIAGV